ncbi:hypothetical protein [Pseudomonas brassicacearum]|uniref:hypothetical protein n=1 Tax=Pseudomonas brassicacearum TaxID=930166 RepID=UPI001DCD96D4|nr:hypothetical protein [Pseudomonas brassicacearum]CAH0290898.1 hypothetical protein SRABI06_04223 [Pseudomonas brassicacearum]
MSRKSTIVGLIGGLVCSSALAELPDHSILTRYGMTSEQLPAAQAGKPVEAPAPRPRFEVQAEKPWASVSLGETRKPDTTGNLSIDRSNQQEHERCLRLQGDSLRRKGAMISCEEGGPRPGVGSGLAQ